MLFSEIKEFYREIKFMEVIDFFEISSLLYLGRRGLKND
jgi:hypothetical protein